MVTLADSQQELRNAQVTDLMHTAQIRLCTALEQLEVQGISVPAIPPDTSDPALVALAPPPHAGQFGGTTWERPGGGGGTARVLTAGVVFERAGVNISAIHGDRVPPGLVAQRPSTEGKAFFATGISLVLHPRNPYVPAFHANFRYFDVGDDWWFGGGMDLTPCYGFAEDAAYFHRTLKAYCERHGLVDYQTVKQACDEYFFIPHRQEMRGIGGIFFDYLHRDGPMSWERVVAFLHEGIDTILTAYLPLVRRRMSTPYGEHERQWQLYWRGRYVEFNLVYDRGTLFGLQTNGYVEAILMSMPPLARWEFAYQPEAGSAEAALADFLQPRNWAEE